MADIQGLWACTIWRGNISVAKKYGDYRHIKRLNNINILAWVGQRRSIQHTILSSNPYPIHLLFSPFFSPSFLSPSSCTGPPISTIPFLDNPPLPPPTAWAASQGYAIVTLRSKKSKLGVVRKAWLCCDKGRKFIAKGLGKRSTSTRQTNCPYEIIAQRDLATERWAFVVEYSTHNHPPTVAGSHPTHRATVMTDEVINTIAVQLRINSTAQQTLSAIRLDTECYVWVLEGYNPRCCDLTTSS